MKKIITLILTVLLTFSLAACGDKEDEIVEVDTNLYTKYTDELEMDFTYKGLDFISDGFGEVTLRQCTDGDTAQFTNGTMNFSVRFLGIDTPESTYRIDPWGKAASKYTCEKLTNATSIVLESEGDKTDGNDRYLAWVWVDGKLLNLELIEQAYSNAKGMANSKYEDLIYEVELSVQRTNRRIWGEDDPTFDYSLDGVQITIEELATHSELYAGQKIVVVGIVAAEVGIHPYLIDENGYGIYVYLGYNNSVTIEPGNKVRISGLNLTYYPDAETGSPQLVGFTKRHVELLSEGNTVTPRELTIDEFVVSDLGSYIKLTDLKVTEIYESPKTGDFTVTVSDADGNTMGLHIDSSVGRFAIDGLAGDGVTFDVTGPLSRYDGQYQLEMSDIGTVVKK
jgi:micrococcal nuclease